MHSRPSQVLHPIVLAVATAAVGMATGCSSAPGSEPSHGSSGAATVSATAPAATAAAADEATRVQAYLDARYLATDVKHSFHSAVGDDIDCVDFANEPSVRALLAQGSTIEDLQEPFHSGEQARAAKAEAAPRSPEYFQGDRDEAGQIRSCPSGSVPHVRLTAAQIAAAGGLDAYVGSFRKVSPTRGGQGSRIHAESTVPEAGGYQEDTGNYAWVQNGYSQAATLSVQGGTSTMTIAAPSLTTASEGHSVAQVWLTGADHPGEERQTLEAGWIATPGATNGVQQPHLFIFTTSDAYAHGCFNGTTESGCPTWVPNASATLALGQSLTPSVQGGTQHELTITISHLRFICRLGTVCLNNVYLGWAINAQIDGGASVELGYYTNASYSSQGTAGLASQGDDFIVGGEVYDATQTFTAPPAVTMGEGAMTLGGASYGYTAYHRDFSYEDGSFNQVLTPSEVDYTDPEYLYNITAAPGSTAWTTYFYYGDWAPLHIIFPNPIKL